MQDTTTTIQELKDKVKTFLKERDWEQFNDPKSVSISIAIEAAELLEKFQWVDNSKSKDELEKHRTEVEHEIADVFNYLLIFCSQNNIDLAKAFENKLKINEQKYSIEKCKGKSDKYTTYKKP
ncbi:MAG: nucleotide pyrophosphohydrolase [Candidatus Babeliales bacterium]|nr:nucleotide pyrophosphohydrolase [Candidatus Babeliales bacterium]